MLANPSTIVAALLAAGIVAACERPSVHAAAPPLESYSRGPAEPLPPLHAAESADDAVATAPSRPPLPSRESISDGVITARIKAALVTDPAMTGADVSVNTDNHVVSLLGTVSSQEQAAIASAHAQRQDGVMRVDNHLAFNLR